MNANSSKYVAEFDSAFPNITRREHWLAIYIAYREEGCAEDLSIERIEFERQHEVAIQPKRIKPRTSLQLSLAAQRARMRELALMHRRFKMDGNAEYAADYLRFAVSARDVSHSYAAMSAKYDDNSGHNAFPKGRWS